MTARAGAGRAAGGVSRTCWPTAPRASRSAWRRRFRRTMSAELCDAALHLIEHSECAQPHAAQIRAGPGFPDRRRRGRSGRGDRGGLHDRPRLVPGARALETEDTGRGTYQSWSRKSPGRCRNRGWSSDRRADQREEAAAARRHARRIGRGHAPRDRAARAHGRCRNADGMPVQAHRARKPHSAQHECAGQGPHSARSWVWPRR